MNRIGVFDSGLGGLTVLDEICKYNRGLDIVYFGDTARVPYGSHTRDTIIHYAQQDVRFLQSLNVEGIVVACGTVSANAMAELNATVNVPILGVIQSAAVEAVKMTKNRRVGVIGTAATIRSHAYRDQIRELDAGIEVMGAACPLLVPMIENGLAPDDPVVMEMTKRYLSGMRDFGADTVIMGCTHYPFYHEAFSRVLPDVQFLHMGTALSKQLKSRLHLDASPEPCRVSYFVSDRDTEFLTIANRYLSTIRVDMVRQTNIEQF